MSKFETDIKPFILISYRVPQHLVRKIVPREFELELDESDIAYNTATVSFSLSYQKSFHWSPLALPSLNFYQATYRANIHIDGHAGVYFFRIDLGSQVSYLWQRALARSASRSQFTFTQGDKTIACHIRNNQFPASFALDSMCEKAAELERAHRFRMLTYRTHYVFQSWLGNHFVQVVDQQIVNPYECKLVSASLPFFEQLGFVSTHDVQHPCSVLLVPEMKSIFSLPKPLYKSDLETTKSPLSSHT